MHAHVEFEIVDVTPEIAAELLEHNIRNRNIREQVWRKYARDMIAGKWVVAESIKIDWNGRIIDGQHRLIAVIESGVTVKMMIIRNLDPNAQSAIDSGSKRSTADALRFNGHGDYATTVAAVARVAIGWDLGGMRSAASSTTREITNAETVEWVEANPNVHEAAAFSHRYAKKIGTTPTALAFAAFKFISVDMQSAIEFISSIAERNMDGVGDPRVALYDALSSYGRRNMRMTTPLQLNILFRAWNQWRAGKTMTTKALMNVAPKTPEPK
ncbi:hypothetical protein D514_0102370 [Microbacterium sp. UCD-TDU]|nr:hypothetical protein D514_0102370 [Microbacterium sp. UCD-TDU]